MLIQSIIQQGSEGVSEPVFFYYDTSGEAAGHKPLDPFFTYQAKIFEGHYYFTMMTDGGNPLNRLTRLYKMQVSDLSIVDSYDIPLEDDTGQNRQDTHPKSQIWIQGGILHLTREVGQSSSSGYSDGHNTDLLYYRLDLTQPLSSITLTKRIVGFHSYPHLKATDTRVVINARGLPSSSSYRNRTFYISLDDGDNFTEQRVIDTLDADKRAYTQDIYSDTDELFVALNIRDDGTSAKTGIHVLRSEDGVVWKNFQKSFSKDVSGLVPVNKTELDNFCLVVEQADAEQDVFFEGACVKNGVIRLLVSLSDIDTGNIDDGNPYVTPQELRLYTMSGGSWIYKDLSGILPAFYHWSGQERFVQLGWDKYFDYVFVIDKTDPDEPIFEYKSSDLFNTYTTRKLGNLSDVGSNHHIGQIVCNAQNPDERLVICFDLLGLVTDPNATSNLTFIKP